MFLCTLGILKNYFKFEENSKGERDEGPPCSKSMRGHRSAKESETPPAERALRIAPVCTELTAARDQGPRDHCKNPGRLAWNRATLLICIHLLESRNIRLGLRHQEEC